MAYVSKEKKAKIAEALKAVMPKGWKFSLAVRHHSAIVCTISAAPVNLLAAIEESEFFKHNTATYATINGYHFRTQVADEAVREQIGAILAALNTDNYDRSDMVTDYFDVGHYVTLNIGRWDKPFTVTA